jgi:tetratricopeptide (TPR) repeat protein
MNDILAKAKQEAEARHLIEARDLLMKAVTQDPSDAEAWYLLSHVVETKLFKCLCLFQVLKIDPDHQMAKDTLDKLEGFEENPAILGDKDKNILEFLVGNAAIDILREIPEAAEADGLGGSEDVSSEDEAEKLTTQIANLKYAKAYHRLGDMYMSRSGFKYDPKKALKYYQESMHYGDHECWGDMAICYQILEDFERADESWLKFLENVYVKDKKNAPAYYVLCFYRYMQVAKGQPHNDFLEWCYQEIKRELGGG